ncbi:unnamed protein product [Acanthoscelides obtectus]|uniref:Uncharacterized protein n=1 Tax=Acanthoscelides obtectus TaxID=200917 RepID=A0A9P0JUB3_ACAOB|nr:unnamed protein product [Acanthoscelides obtectus]CAK1661791.1 Deoxyribonuclease-2-alpha [Acanthoscelides obtectus]
MKSILRILTGFCAFYVTFAIQCKDESDKPVDWFYVYKLPTIRHQSGNKLLKDGVAYTFMTSEDYSDWKFSNVSINSTDSIIGHTLKDLYKRQNELLHVLYNDQPPQHKSNEEKGHNKGVILAESQGGFWLVHSVPHFPDIGDKTYNFPRTGAVYGQSFLCISTDLRNLDTVGMSQMAFAATFLYQISVVKTTKT